MQIIFSILTLYSWVLGAGLIVFVLLIARFYEKKYAQLYTSEPRRKTYYFLFLVAVVLFLVSAVRYAIWVWDFAGDMGADLALLIGGIVLAVLGYHLQRMMMGGHP